MREKNDKGEGFGLRLIKGEEVRRFVYAVFSGLKLVIRMSVSFFLVQRGHLSHRFISCFQGKVSRGSECFSQTPSASVTLNKVLYLGAAGPEPHPERPYLPSITYPWPAPSYTKEVQRGKVWAASSLPYAVGPQQ